MFFIICINFCADKFLHTLLARKLEIHARMYFWAPSELILFTRFNFRAVTLHILKFITDFCAILSKSRLCAKLYEKLSAQTLVRIMSRMPNEGKFMNLGSYIEFEIGMKIFRNRYGILIYTYLFSYFWNTILVQKSQSKLT